MPIAEAGVHCIRECRLPGPEPAVPLLNFLSLAENQTVMDLSFKSITLGFRICVQKIGGTRLVATIARPSEKVFAGAVGQ